MAKQHLEIERRWLLSAMPPEEVLNHRLTDHRKYLTGYLLTGDPELRVRRSRVVAGPKIDRTFFSMTLKFGEGLARDEFIHDITEQFFLDKIEFAVASVSKIRYRVKVAGVVWEFDQFLYGNLFLAEVELKLRDQVVVFPPWLEPIIVKEVTNDPRYHNKNIALRGIPNPR